MMGIVLTIRDVLLPKIKLANRTQTLQVSWPFFNTLTKPKDVFRRIFGDIIVYNVTLMHKPWSN